MPDSLLDSSTYIDLERAQRKLREKWARSCIARFDRYRRIHGSPALSSITVIEIPRGLYNRFGAERAASFESLARQDYDILSVDLSIAMRSAEIMAKLQPTHQTIGLADSIIAATAIERSLVLVTSNVKHFQRVADAGYPLTIESWRQH